MDAEEWSARALESVLSPAGYAVVRAESGTEGLKQARTHPPDLILINIDLPDGNGVGLCLMLRADPRVGPSVPILLTGTHPTQKQHLAALESGAWDFLTYPLDSDELLLKLHTYTQAKADVDRARREMLIDETTGLYDLRGLERRALELRSLARRNQQALACVVLAPSLASEDSQSAAGATVVRMAETLKTTGRASDSIGRTGETKFAIFAPNTGADGAAKMVQRLAGAIHSAPVRDEAPVPLRAGHAAVENVGEAPTEAQDLLAHATIALGWAMAEGDKGWMQGFETGVELD